MKTTVTQTKVLTLITGLAVLASASLRANAPAQKRGTDILHYTVQASMTAEAVVSSATGIVHLHHKAQGNVIQEMLTISVRGLEANEPYRLVVPAANPADPASLPTLVANFTTDRKGNATLRYKETTHANGNLSSNGKGKANGHSKSNGKQSLPVPVDPLTGVEKLAVIDAAGATLLSVNLAAPSKFAYLIKRDIGTATVRASLRLVANHDAATVTLYATGLTPSANYSLKLNGGTPEVFAADTGGRLTAQVDLEIPVYILQVGTVELLDAASVVILSATLP